MSKGALANSVLPELDAVAGADGDLCCDSLFAATHEPTLILESRSGSIISANTAAARLLGVPRTLLARMPLATLLDTRCHAPIQAALRAVRSNGVAHLHSIRFRGAVVAVDIRLSLARRGPHCYVLVHLSTDERDAERCGGSRAYAALDAANTMLVVTDVELNLLYANQAFLELIGVGSMQAVLGAPLSRWLELADQDLARMGEQMAAREMAMTMRVRLTGRCADSPHLRALAIAVPDEGQPLWGFSLSSRSRIN